MDATTLRIILLLLGAIFLAGIYLYETNRRKRASTQARRKRAEKISAEKKKESAKVQSKPVEGPDED
jgi:FtsZ-interacting cell division protein ZipA